MPYDTQNLELILNETDYTSIFKYENTTSRRLYVNKFDLLPDVYYANYGLVQVLKNGVVVFETKDQDGLNPLAEYSNFPIRAKLLFLDPHDTIEILGLLLESESSKLTVSFDFDFVSSPAPDTVIPFSIAEKTIVSKKVTLFPEKFYEQTINEPHYSVIDNPNYNNMQITIDANIGYNPEKIEEFQNDDPLNLEKFVNAYRGNNSRLSKVGSISSDGGLLSFVYETEQEREPDIEDIRKLTLTTPFILNPDPIDSYFTFNNDGSKYYLVEIIGNTSTVRISEYDLTEKFNMATNNRTLNAQKTVSTIIPLGSIGGVFWGPSGHEFYFYGIESATARKFLIGFQLRDSYLIETLDTATRPFFQWPYTDTFLSLTIPNADGCFYFLSIDNTATQASLTLRKYSFTPSNTLQTPVLISSKTGFYEFGNVRNIIGAQFSTDGKILFLLTELKDGDQTQNMLSSVVLNEPFVFETNLRQNFTTTFEYSKFLVDHSNHTIIAKNANFNINEWFIFSVITGSGWAFYNPDGTFFHPTDVTGEYIADVTKFDTKNDTEETRSYRFILSSSNSFTLDVVYSYFQSISRTHEYSYTRRPRPLPSFPQLYDVEESISNKYYFKGKRIYTENRNVLRAYGSDSPDFTDETFLFEENEWDGASLTANIDTDKKYIKFEKLVSYQFIVEDYSNTLEQREDRNGRYRTLIPVLKTKYSDSIEFLNALPAGREFLPNRFMMYYNEPLPASMQLYAPTFLNKTVDKVPKKSLFDFTLSSRLPLPSSNIVIGLDIIGEGGNWYNLLNTIGSIEPVGKTLLELKQFDIQNTLVLPKGKNVLRARLSAEQKVKLSVVALLS